MKTCVFQQEGAVSAGGYVAGHGAWLHDQWLDRAELEIQPPATGQCVLQLELGGVLQAAARFTVGPGDRRWRSTMPLKTLLSGGVWARWKVVSFTGAPGDEATGARITIYLGPDTVARAVKPVPALEVRWVSGFERLVLWSYDAATHTFTESLESLAAGRAGLEIEAGVMRVLIGAAVVLRAEAGVLHAGGFKSGTAGLRTEPRLEFWEGARRVGSVNADGMLAAPQIRQEVEVTNGGAFQFRGLTGDPVAHLGVGGLRALAFQDDL